MANENRTKNQGTAHFEIAIYRVLHKRTSTTASFGWHLSFQEKSTFTHAICVNSGNANSKTKIRRLYIMKILYT